MVARGGRSRPSMAYATPVHPCTMESNHRHVDFQNERSIFNILLISRLRCLSINKVPVNASKRL
jgi:hypothetical protein